MTQDKAPEWAMETAFRRVPILNGQITEQAHFIALALSQAYERGQRDMQERAAGVADDAIDENGRMSFVQTHGWIGLRKVTTTAIRSLPIEQDRKP